MGERKRPAGAAERDEPLAGERLAAARRDQDISIRDIAKELHLDEVRVQALEQNQFETLGAPVFAKGYLRKYAEIVGVSIDDVLADYYSLNRSVGAPPIVGPPRQVARDIDLSRLVVPGIVVLVVLGVFLWWVQSGSPVPSVGTGDETVPAASDLELERPSAAGAPADADEIVVPMAPPATDPAPAEPARPEAEIAAVEDTVEPSAGPSPAPDRPAAQGPQVGLALSFSGDCWTEVTDAGGSRLFFDLGRAGRTVTVSGTAPLRVLFGDYANVSVRVDGEPMPIPASAIRGETARFSVNPR